jgi:hypothetical protein
MPRRISFFIFFMFTCNLFPQPSAPLKIFRGECPISNITPEEARIRAIREARQSAVESRCGVGMRSESMVKDLMLSGDWIRSTSYGQIIREKMLKESVKVDQSASNLPPSLVYAVEMEMDVQCETGRPDPAFQIGLSLNKSSFTTGEEMILSLTAAQDCYLTLVDFASDDRVYILMPSPVLRDNFLPGRRTVEIPNPAQRSAGIHFRVAALPGERESTEVIQIIALKKKVDFIDGLETENGFGMIPNLTAAGTRLARWLASIPIEDRAETQAIIRISAR